MSHTHDTSNVTNIVNFRSFNSNIIIVKNAVQKETGVLTFLDNIPENAKLGTFYVHGTIHFHKLGT